MRMDLLVVVALGAAAGLAGRVASADDAPPPERVELSRDANELAASAQRNGDARIVAELVREAVSREARLEAIREAPFLHVPEATLAALVGFASSRDPDLAPAAASAIHRIVEAIDARRLDMLELDRGVLDAAREGLHRLAADPTRRRDLRGLAAFDAAQLERIVASD